LSLKPCGRNRGDIPATGRERRVTYIRKIDPNIHAGVKYIGRIRDERFGNEPMDELNRDLFAFAAYNAGPGRINGLRKIAADRGLNPNVWLGSVELVAAEKVGRETVSYVGNIFKYYVAYTLVMEGTSLRNAPLPQRE
jgi:membrane-bound lytic murein transglycosylase MltF